jgi:hypothetical protein
MKQHTITHNILTKTAADTGHMDLSDAGYILVQTTPLPITQLVKAGALFLFRGGMERELIKSPQLQAIGYSRNSTGFVFINLQFNPVPVTLFEKLVMVSDVDTMFLILKMEEKKTDERLIGPPREWNAGYAILGVVSVSGDEIMLAGKAGKATRS